MNGMCRAIARWLRQPRLGRHPTTHAPRRRPSRRVIELWPACARVGACREAGGSGRQAIYAAPTWPAAATTSSELAGRGASQQQAEQQQAEQQRRPAAVCSWRGCCCCRQQQQQFRVLAWRLAPDAAAAAAATQRAAATACRPGPTQAAPVLVRPRLRRDQQPCAAPAAATAARAPTPAAATDACLGTAAARHQQ